jgi:hypothetical protein
MYFVPLFFVCGDSTILVEVHMDVFILDFDQKSGITAQGLVELARFREQP